MVSGRNGRVEPGKEGCAAATIPKDPKDGLIPSEGSTIRKLFSETIVALSFGLFKYTRSM